MRDRRRYLNIIGTITRDFIPDISIQDLQIIIAASNVPSQDCLDFLQDRISFYESHIAAESLQTFTAQTRGWPATINHLNNANTMLERGSPASVATQTLPVQASRRPERNEDQQSTAEPPPRVPATTHVASIQPSRRSARNTDQRRLPSSTDSASNSTPTISTGQKRSNKRKATTSLNEPRTRQAPSRSPTAFPSIEEFRVGVDEEVIHVVRTLEKMSRSQEFPKKPPDVASVAAGKAGDFSLIQGYLTDITLLTSAMIHCQDATVESEHACGNVRINAAIWKIMYMDWYDHVEVMMYRSKEDRTKEAWKTLKTILEKRYQNAHSNQSSSAYRMFLTRCRKLQDIRDLGLQYIIFVPKLAIWAEKLTSNAWRQWKTELVRLDVLSNVDKLIERHCPNWLDMLKVMYPRWESLPSHDGPQGNMNNGPEFHKLVKELANEANKHIQRNSTSIHSFPTTDTVSSYLQGFRLFLEIYPLVSVPRFIEMIFFLSREFFHQSTLETFLVNNDSCEKNPLIASLLNFVLCLGAYYSGNYNERLAIRLYENGKKYISLLNSISLILPIKAFVVLICGITEFHFKHNVDEAGRLVEDEISLSTDDSTSGGISIINHPCYEELGSLVYQSYVAHELLCLYSDISLLWKGGDMLRTLTLFGAYIAKVVDNRTFVSPASSELQLFHSKIECLAMKLREAEMGWFKEDSHVMNQMKLFASLDPWENPGLPKSRSACLQLRVAHFRVVACTTFRGIEDFRCIFNSTAQESLKMLDSNSTIPEMARFGRAFTFNYMYAKCSIDAPAQETVERWITPGLEEVCFLIHESDFYEASGGMASVNMGTKRNLIS